MWGEGSVNPINAAADQSIFVCVNRLEDFEEVVWGDNVLGENGGLFILGIASPSRCFCLKLVSCNCVVKFQSPTITDKVLVSS